MSHSTDGFYEVYEETTRKARKEHQCDACQLPIKPGHLYVYVATVFEREFKTHKRCGACQVTHVHLRQVCRERTDYEMWPNERLNCGINYEDEWEEEPPIEIAALPFLTDEERGTLLAKAVIE